MRTYATAQLTGDRRNQCDATATSAFGSTRAYVLLDGIGDEPEVRTWTRETARTLARTAARREEAEPALRATYDRIAADPGHDYTRDPSAVAVVAVVTPGRPMTVAWCGDARAYVLTPRGGLQRLTVDHNLRQLLIDHGRRQRPNARHKITSFLGNDQAEPLPGERPLIGSVSRGPEHGRLLLASDGAYEPLEDSARDLTHYLTGPPPEAARSLTRAAIDHASAYADNATALVADLPALP